MGKGKQGRIRFDYVGHIYTSGEWVRIEVEVFGGFVKSFGMIPRISEWFGPEEQGRRPRG